MKQIRKSVFETNSSSTHCICIVTERDAELAYPAKVVFRCEDFGWEVSDLVSVEEKAAYLYASILSLLDRKEAENAKNWIMDELAKVGVACEFEEPQYRNYGYGYYCVNASIDHAGEDDHEEFVKRILRNKGRLIRYLFSDKSLVITGNDNDYNDRPEEFQADYSYERYYKGN